MVAQKLIGGMLAAPGPMTHDGTPRLGQPIGGTGGEIERYRAQCEGVADRDFARESAGLRAPDDRDDLFDATLAAVVQMNVDTTPWRWRRRTPRQDGRRGRGRCRLDRGRRRDLRLGDRLVEQRRRAGRADDPLRRKATISIVTTSRNRSSHFEDGVQIAEANWLSMSTWCACAACRWRPPASRAWRRSRSRKPCRFRSRTSRSAAMRSATVGLPPEFGHPGQAEQVFVEMDVAVDGSGGRTRPARSPGEGGRRAAMRRPSDRRCGGAVRQKRVAKASSAASLRGFRLGRHGVEGPRRRREAAARAVGTDLDLLSPRAARICRPRDRACSCRGNRARRPLRRITAMAELIDVVLDAPMESTRLVRTVLGRTSPVMISSGMPLPVVSGVPS